jgi:hypothetical protein
LHFLYQVGFFEALRVHNYARHLDGDQERLDHDWRTHRNNTSGKHGEHITNPERTSLKSRERRVIEAADLRSTANSQTERIISFSPSMRTSFPPSLGPDEYSQFEPGQRPEHLRDDLLAFTSENNY